MKRGALTLVSIFAAALVFLGAGTGTALAYDCFPVNKPTGAGSAATLDMRDGSLTFNKPNPGTEEQTHGGFVTIVNPEGESYDIFTHSYLPPVDLERLSDMNPNAQERALARLSDGKGIDSVEAVGGWPEE